MASDGKDMNAHPWPLLGARTSMRILPEALLLEKRRLAEPRASETPGNANARNISRCIANVCVCVCALRMIRRKPSQPYHCAESFPARAAIEFACVFGVSDDALKRN